MVVECKTKKMYLIFFLKQKGQREERNRKKNEKIMAYGENVIAFVQVFIVEGISPRVT